MATLDASNPELVELLAEIQSRITEQRNQAFGAQALSWLALVPAWTETLAARCDFPADPDLRGFLEN